MKPRIIFVVFAFLILHFIFSIRLLAADTWVKTYQPFYDPAGENDYYVEDVRVCPDSGYAINGHYWFFDYWTEEQCGYLMKTDSDGDLLWAKKDTVSFYDYTEATAFVVLNDGSFICAGRNAWMGGGYYLMKRYTNGNKEWEIQVNYSIKAMELTDDGNIITTGSSMEGPANLQKFDWDGNLIWRKLYLPAGFDFGGGYSVMQTADGGYTITGSVYGTNNRDILVVKTDENGDSLWSWTYNGSANYSDIGNCIIENSDGELLIGANISDYNYRDYFGYLIKMNSIGDTIWTQKITGTTSILSLIQIIDNDYLLRCNNNITKIQDNKEIIWQVPSLVDLNASGDRTILELPDQSIIYLGRQYWGDYISIVKCDSTGQLPIDENNIQLLSSLRCYPNPINQEARIYYNIPKSGNTEIKIYNVKGQLIEPLLHGQKLAGEHTFVWNTKGYPTGVYFIKLTADEKESVKKMVLIR